MERPWRGRGEAQRKPERPREAHSGPERTGTGFGTEPVPHDSGPETPRGSAGDFFGVSSCVSSLPSPPFSSAPVGVSPLPLRGLRKSIFCNICFFQNQGSIWPCFPVRALPFFLLCLLFMSSSFCFFLQLSVVPSAKMRCQCQDANHFHTSIATLYKTRKTRITECRSPHLNRDDTWENMC